ncbi:MAG TPA: type II toxin-antitoxin system VapC family toxin [Spirochaetales bacterium]|nr:type II toxin-antitoxin system VapC family toxin [Spirochaetales bacterium]
MSLLYLLDTCIVSEPVKMSANKNVMHMLASNEGKFAISSVVWHELHFGMFRLPESKKRDMLEKYLHEAILPCLPILPYDENAAELHGELRASLASKGLTPAFTDSMIASICLVNNLILVTRNVNDFKTFADLKIENWFEIN